MQDKDLRQIGRNGLQQGKSLFTRIHKNRPENEKGQATACPSFLLPAAGRHFTVSHRHGASTMGLGIESQAPATSFPT